jgi:hypothetical protein
LDKLAENQAKTNDKLPNNVLRYKADALMDANQKYGTGKTQLFTGKTRPENRS